MPAPLPQQWRGANADALYGGAHSAFFEGRYGDAVALFTAALRLDPKDARSLYYRGLAYDRLGVAAQAQADWKRAAKLERSLQIDPKSVSVALTRIQGPERLRLEEYRR